MWGILALLLSCALLAALILPWLNRARIARLEDDVAALRRQLRAVTVPETPSPPIADAPFAAPAAPPPASDDDWDVAPQRDPAPAAAATASPAPARPRLSFEQQFGARLPVWFGGLALILAGFFLVKYSIETGLLGPAVRTVLGLCFGAGLLAGGQWIRRRPRFANGARIAQALTGAGIAVLYICVFAATTLYEFVPSWLGFAGMAAVTALAVALALEHGAPIALMGLLGGFFTPALISTGHPSAPLLFSYLYLVLAGVMLVIRERGWWLMVLPTVGGAFLWCLIWLFAGLFAPGDALWLGLFLIAVSGTVTALSHRHYAQDQAEGVLLGWSRLSGGLHYFTAGGALVLLGVTAGIGGFSLFDWGLFGLLAAGGIALAFFNQRLYGWVPCFAMLTSAVMLLAWRMPAPDGFAIVLFGFAALYGVSGYALQARSVQPLLWAALTVTTALLYYLIGYFELRTAPFWTGIPHVWGGLALALAILFSAAVQKMARQIPAEHAQRDRLLALYAGAATSFVALALTIELPRDFLPVAFALEMTVLCWLHRRLPLPGLRRLAAVLALLFAALLSPQLILLAQLAIFSLTEAQMRWQETVPLVDWPWFQLGLPGLCFAASSWLLRARQDDRIAYGFELAAVALFGVMGYYLMRHAFHLDANVLFVKAGFIERGAITNALFLYSLACLALARRYGRRSLLAGGVTLGGIALFRTGYFDLIRYNPLWAMQEVGATPLFNGLWLAYALPALWLWLGLRQLPEAWRARVGLYGYGAMLVLLFSFVSLQVRQAFQGTLLSAASASNAEIYTYSVIWLLLGVLMLGLGTLRRDRMLRLASLVLMILTVGKVFLYDAAALTGLYRVFSFFGLGLSLLLLSWFYARFVFKTKPD